MADFTATDWNDNSAPTVMAAELDRLEAGVKDAAQNSKQRDVIANRPAASAANKNWIWIASDDDNYISYSNGSSWITIGTRRKGGPPRLTTVRVAAVTNISVASLPATIDGVSLSTGDRILLVGQTAPAENGVYSSNGTGAAPSRAGDFNDNSEFVKGCLIDVTEGTLLKGKVFTLVTDNPSIGSDPITFTWDGVVGGNVAMTAFTGGTIYSPVKTITHGLGTTPSSVVCTIRGGGIRGMFAITQNIGATTFDAQSVSADGTPLNTQSAGTLDWIARI